MAVYSDEYFWRVTGSHVYMQDMMGPGWRDVPDHHLVRVIDERITLTELEKL